MIKRGVAHFVQGRHCTARQPDTPQEPEEDDLRGSEFVLWRVYDAGGSLLTLKVRYQDEREVPYWQDGPDLFTALAQAAAEGWDAYDREPGNLPGEYAIVHLKRDAARQRGSAALS